MIYLRELLLSLQSLKTADVHFDFTDPEFAWDSREDRRGDLIVQEVLEALETEKLGRVSCVSQHWSEIAVSQWYHGKEMRNIMPYTSPAFQELKQKYRP